MASLTTAVLTIHPRLKLEQPASRIFFGHINDEFGDNYSRAAEVLIEMTDGELDRDVAAQILATSRICARKAYLFRYALTFLGAAIALWALSLPFSFYVINHLRSTK
jgi:hypothetical protein